MRYGTRVATISAASTPTQRPKSRSPSRNTPTTSAPIAAITSASITAWPPSPKSDAGMPTRIASGWGVGATATL
ncbi:MAG TPA: hypothetical protein VH817_15025 [Thermoleophilaceae bacterium]